LRSHLLLTAINYKVTVFFFMQQKLAHKLKERKKERKKENPDTKLLALEHRFIRK